MTANVPAVTTSRSIFREYLPASLATLGFVLLVIWLFRGNGIQVLLGWDPVLLWVVFLASLTMVMIAIGQICTHRWMGILISSLNKMSLARLQIALWTLMVLSAYFTIAFHRLYGTPAPMDPEALAKCQEALGKEKVTAEECGGGSINIAFPPELLVAMGISAASFAGTSIIQNNKKGKTIALNTGDPRVEAAQEKQARALEDLEAAERALDEAGDRKLEEQLKLEGKPDETVTGTMKAGIEREYNLALLRHQSAKNAVDAAQKKLDEALTAQQKAQEEADGLLYKKDRIEDARFGDIFMGDEIGNYQIVDMSKVQMFFLTFVVLAVYAEAVAVTLHDAALMNNPMVYNFPAFSESMNFLMAISHGTYLSVKNVDHTKTAP